AILAVVASNSASLTPSGNMPPGQNGGHEHSTAAPNGGHEHSTAAPNGHRRLKSDAGPLNNRHHNHASSTDKSAAVARAHSFAPGPRVVPRHHQHHQQQNQHGAALGHRRMHSCPPTPHQLFLPGLAILPGGFNTESIVDNRQDQHQHGNSRARDYELAVGATQLETPTTSASDGDDVGIVNDASEATTTTTSTEPELDPKLTQCGLFCYHPACLQPLARPLPFLVSVIGLYFVQSFIVSGYINSINTTIELRYGLTTKEIGYIYASYEVFCIVATFFISYFGHGGNRSRLLGIGCAIIGIGYFFFAFPHFLGSAISNTVPVSGNASSSSTGSSASTISSSGVKLCSGGGGGGTSDMNCQVQDSALLILCLSFGLIGLGASPVYILAPTYLWDNVPQKSYPLYAASLHITSALGPACGFLGGAVFLSLYVNFPSSAPDGLTTSHPLWTGAWWLGFVIFAGLALLVAVPLLAFPTVMPHTAAKRLQKQQQQQQQQQQQKAQRSTSSLDADELTRNSSTTNSDAAIVSSTNDDDEEPNSSLDQSAASLSPAEKPHIRDIPAGLKRLFKNALWLFISLLIVAEQSVVQAFVAYVNKYMQKSFNIPVTQSSIITGALVIPSAVIGIGAGALIMRRYRPSNKSVSLLMMGLCAATTLLTIGLAFCTCPNVSMAGLNAQYGIPATSGAAASSSTAAAQLQLNVSCNAACHCGSLSYDPACDALTGTTYFTPCHAGCQSKQSSTGSSDSWNYTDCSCVPIATNASLPGGYVTGGKCTAACYTFGPFCALLFIIVLLTACGYEPSHILTLSCVSESDSSFALGIQNILQRLLAFIPAPIYFGSLFDFNCLMRSSDSACSNADASACMEYDLTRLPYMWIGVILGLKVVGFLFASACFLVSRASRAVDLLDVAADATVAKEKDGGAMSASTKTAVQIGAYSSKTDVDGNHVA
ncbi:hypothetical protein BOX15_Mlig020478g1, partial [Macrostomum lignano]